MSAVTRETYWETMVNEREKLRGGGADREAAGRRDTECCRFIEILLYMTCVLIPFLAGTAACPCGSTSD